MSMPTCPQCAYDGNYGQRNVIYNYLYTAVKWKQLFISHFGIIILISAQQKVYQLHANQTEYILLKGGGGSVYKILCLNYHSGYKWPRWWHLNNILSSLKFQFFFTSESIKERILRTWRITRSIKNIK